MTAPTPQPPAGWYPDPQGTTRWWDGQGWTTHVQPAAPLRAPQLPSVPAGTATGTVWIWLIAVLPLIAAVPAAGYLLVLSQQMGVAFAHITDVTSQQDFSNEFLRMETTWIFSPWYFALVGTGLVIYGLTVLFAFLDRRELAGRGFAKPFHWAWAFLESPWVYMIGRSVVVHRRSGRGLAPLWVFIGIEVVAFGAGMVVTFAFLGQFTQQLSQLSGAYTS
jgi:hypothetical protein